MKKLLVLLGVLAFFVGSVVRSQDEPGRAGGVKHAVVRPDTIEWGPAPPVLPPGSRVAILVGDPSQPSVPYVLRAKLPDGYKIPPHWHPTDENITVLQGTLLIGMGERFDPTVMEEMSASSFVCMPKAMRHFATAKGETIIQVHGLGPFDFNYVNPADDPRKKEGKK
jgi:quercetin dioxygenase-like cupin family protein